MALIVVVAEREKSFVLQLPKVDGSLPSEGVHFAEKKENIENPRMLNGQMFFVDWCHAKADIDFPV